MLVKEDHSRWPPPRRGATLKAVGSLPVVGLVAWREAFVLRRGVTLVRKPTGRSHSYTEASFAAGSSVFNAFLHKTTCRIHRRSEGCAA